MLIIVVWTHNLPAYMHIARKERSSGKITVAPRIGGAIIIKGLLCQRRLIVIAGRPLEHIAAPFCKTMPDRE